MNAEDPYLTNAEDPYLMNAEDPYLTNAKDPYLTNAEDLYLTNAEDPYLTNAEDLYLINAEDLYLTNAEDPYLTNAEDPYITNTKESFSPTIDICSAQLLYATTTYKPPTFLHPIYKRFMEIVMKYCLSDSTSNELLNWFNEYQMDPLVSLSANTRQGHALLDTIDILYILYNKTVVMEYNGIEYILHHWPLFDAVKKLLSNPDIFQYCIFNYTPTFVTNDKGEL